jgi:hypothetical protein
LIFSIPKMHYKGREKNKKEEYILVILEIPIYRSLWIKSSIELAQPYTVGPSPQPFWTYFTGEIPKICLKICRPRNSPQSLCWWAHARVQLFPPVNLGLHSFEQIEAKIIHLRAFQTNKILHKSLSCDRKKIKWKAFFFLRVIFYSGRKVVFTLTSFKGSKLVVDSRNLVVPTSIKIFKQKYDHGPTNFQCL